MSKPVNIKAFWGSCAVVVLVLALFCTSIAANETEPPPSAGDKLARLTQEEKATLQELFALTQEISLMENREKELAGEIDRLLEEIKMQERSIASQEAAYKRKQKALEAVLKSYQRMGATSYLEILLDSGSLADFVQRLNILRDITRNTGELLEQLEASRQRLTEGRDLLAGKLGLMEEKQQQARDALAERAEKKKKLEDFLLSLKEERAYYQEQLSRIQQLLQELKPLLEEAAAEFANLVQDGKLPQDAVKISFSLLGIKGTLEEVVFNDIISKHTRLPQMVFDFKRGMVEMNLPEKNVVLSGIFTIEEGYKLSFAASGGYLYGMPLEDGIVADLFSQGQLAIDLKPLLGSSSVQRLEIMDGYLELYIK